MNTVKIKSYAKINVTLEITGVENGYHMLDSLVASIDLFDLIVLKKRKDKLSSVIMKGMGSESIPPEKNNALKAAETFCEAFHTNGVDITVYKNIPMGAGLGGSSADVAGVLNGMAQLYEVTDRAALKSIADTLGSDTGYMLSGGFARMQGRGEKVTPLALSETLHLLLICPPTDVSSGACYKQYDEMVLKEKDSQNATGKCIAALTQNGAKEGGRYAMNDLFAPACMLNADVKKAYEDACAFSPIGAAMTGSGSCVFALFETKELCQWAQSRYKGKFRTYVAETLIPDYAKNKKSLGLRNPFVLSETEIAEE